jgi:hypothetical protein
MKQEKTKGRLYEVDGLQRIRYLDSMTRIALALGLFSGLLTSFGALDRVKLIIELKHPEDNQIQVPTINQSELR